MNDRQMHEKKIDSSAYLAPVAVICGDVELGEQSSVWFHATIRADYPIRIGARTNIQDNAVVHVDDGFAVSIGEEVTVGHSCIIHGCTIGDRCLIGMGSILMNGARVGSDCIIGAGSLITQNTIIPAGSLVYGRPGKVIRALTAEEKETIRKDAALYVRHAKQYKEAERSQDASPLCG